MIGASGVTLWRNERSSNARWVALTGEQVANARA